MNKVSENLVLVRAVFLACKQPPSHYVLTWPFLSAHVWRKRVSELSWFSFYKETNLVGSGTHSEDLI